MSKTQVAVCPVAAVSGPVPLASAIDMAVKIVSAPAARGRFPVVFIRPTPFQ